MGNLIDKNTAILGKIMIIQ